MRIQAWLITWYQTVGKETNRTLNICRIFYPAMGRRFALSASVVPPADPKSLEPSWPFTFFDTFVGWFCKDLIFLG
jgi:hypothetical protein